MNAFKVLDLEYRKRCVELSRVGVGTTDYYVVKRRQEIFSVVLGVLHSYSWVKREEVKKKIKYFIENGYDYDALSKEFNISKKSAYVMISRAGKQFQEAIGVTNVAELIEGNFNIEDIELKDGSITKLFIGDIREHLVVKEYDDIDLLECMPELTTLKNLTKHRLNSVLKNLDSEKVAHILYVLQTNKIEYALEKELIGAYIGGVIKGKEEIALRLKDLYNVVE